MYKILLFTELFQILENGPNGDKVQPSFMVFQKQNILITRLTYNCAHLRSTKETLTIEYFRIILKKIWVKIFLGENFWG